MNANGLTVDLPGGSPLLSGADLHVAPGDTVGRRTAAPRHCPRAAEEARLGAGRRGDQRRSTLGAFHERRWRLAAESTRDNTENAFYRIEPEMKP